MATWKILDFDMRRGEEACTYSLFPDNADDLHRCIVCGRKGAGLHPTQEVTMDFAFETDAKMQPDGTFAVELGATGPIGMRVFWDYFPDVRFHVQSWEDRAGTLRQYTAVARWCAEKTTKQEVAHAS